jgi:aminocarboxymuconate-semialdehyde decarboxylase
MPAKPIVIDFHAHVATAEVFEATYPLSVIGRLRAKAEGIHPMPEGQMARMTDLATRLADMDAMGVDIQVISPSILHQCTYSLDPEEALRLERIGNDHVAETVAKRPDRLIGLGSVPLQDATGHNARCCRPREGVDPVSQSVSCNVAALLPGQCLLGPRLRGDDRNVRCVELQKFAARATAAQY